MEVTTELWVTMLCALHKAGLSPLTLNSGLLPGPPSTHLPTSTGFCSELDSY